ncbi:hypothetical protein IAT40_001581 [Kwoniella sp. CBS 6097]
MSESVLDDIRPAAAADAPEVGKKRKRTGKEREERKRLAIQAQKEAEEAAKVANAAEVLTADNASAAPGAGGESSGAVADSAGSAEGGKAAVDAEKAITRTPQALKTLHPVFKQAKSFETRRLIKKIKFLRTKPDVQAELADLEGQLSILHDIQLHPLSQSHLFLKLRKHPSFKHTPLPSTLVDLLTPPKPTSTASSTSSAPALVGKVENRLCSAKNVADVMRGVVSWVLGEEGAKLTAVKMPKERDTSSQTVAKGKTASQGRQQVDLGQIGGDGDGDDLDDVYQGSRNLVVGSDDENDEEDGGMGRYQDLAADAAGWESGSIGGDDLDDISDDGSESDSDAIDIPPAAKRSKTQPAAKQQQQPKAQIQGKPQKVEKGDITSSMFLPSLSTGFTRGDEGDSDPDLDYDPDGVIGKQGAVRKNRRGQRARQAIWEKKYGKNAKHVVKARTEDEAKQARKSQREFDKRGKPEGMNGRDAGWGKRSGPSDRPSVAATAGASRPSFSASSASAGAGAGAGRPKVQEEQKKNLHPSWEAARLRKQKMGAVPAAGAAKPNKIVFD